ncbi:MAG TPA: hypothetical protein VH436_21425 [Vicinamibacterales bacterium]
MVRRRVQAALAAAREHSQQRRERVAEAETRYDQFLANVAVPLARQVVNVLKAEGRTFTVSTPGRSVRLEPDRGRDDFVEIALSTEADPPTVVGVIRYTRGSRTIDEERPVKSGAAPDQISEDDLLEFLVRALEPWIGR